jgi:hypothetical protein
MKAGDSPPSSLVVSSPLSPLLNDAVIFSGSSEDSCTSRCSAMRNLDEVLEGIGGSGTYQVLLAILVGTLFGFSGMLQVSFLFTGRSPELSCPGTDGTTGDGGCTVSEACAQPLPLSQYLQPTYTFNSYAAEFGLLCNDSWPAALLTSTMYLGLGVGAPVAGQFMSRKFIT